MVQANAMPRKANEVAPFVFIIESPSPQDVLEGRSEGEALSSALNLANVRNRLFRPFNAQMLALSFTKALDEIEPPRPREPKPVFWPAFHFSAHGNEDGLELTDGEFLPWHMLGQSLLAVARSIDLFHPDESHALIQTSFSTCSGAYARRMYSLGAPYPCISVVGPRKKVAWSDSLTAFVTFFHLMIHKRCGINEAVEAMNRAAGLRGVFEYAMSPAVDLP